MNPLMDKRELISAGKFFKHLHCNLLEVYSNLYPNVINACGLFVMNPSTNKVGNVKLLTITDILYKPQHRYNGQCLGVDHKHSS